MSRDERSPLTEDAVELLRSSLETVHEPDAMNPVETELSDGIYVGTYPSSNDAEHGVLYVYIADPEYHLHRSAPPFLHHATPPLKQLSNELRAILYDTLGKDYEFECQSDDPVGGVYYAATIAAEQESITYEDSSESS